MDEEILQFCAKKGLLLDKDSIEFLEQLNKDVARKVLEKIVTIKTSRFISKNFFYQHIDKILDILQETDKKEVERVLVKFGFSVTIKKESVSEQAVVEEKERQAGKESFRILFNYVPKTKAIEVEDFVRHFRSRFLALKNILQERAELEGLTAINRLTQQRRDVSVIGMVVSKRVTKNKNLLLELEDLTGRTLVLVSKNKPELFSIAKNVLLDDVIAVSGSGTREMIFANNIVFPDAALPEKKKLNKDILVAFTADLHVGSKMFLEENFLRFVDWLNMKNGDKEQKKLASKVKYLFITGDTVDGVGIYPGQEELLEIKDVKQQYEKLAELLGMIRKDIKIIMCPGQHDAVRVAEPQPAIGRDYGEALYKLENLHLVSNPAIVEISDGNNSVRILMYHGASMHDVINEIEELRLNRGHDIPAKVVTYLLKRRHLAPTHSAQVYIPDSEEDLLVIKDVPDIVATGDLHRPDIELYNNILVVASSCWQSITPFEEKVGNDPDPCKVPLLNLRTREIKILDFS